MKTLLYQPVNLTDVYQPNPRFPGVGQPNPTNAPQWVAQTDWYASCRDMGFLDAMFVGNQDLNRVSWWTNAIGTPSPSSVPPVPYSPGATDQQNSLPPNIPAVQAFAKLNLNPSRFGANALPRIPMIFDIEDDGTGLWAKTLYAGMNTTPSQRQNANQLMTGVVRAVKQIDAQIPVGWYGAPYTADLPITNEMSREAYRDTFAANAELAEELDMGVYDLYAWDDVIANPDVAYDIAGRIKGAYEQFYPELFQRRMVLISPVLEPNLNGSNAKLAGQPMPLSDWQRLVDYIIGIDQPWAICIWPGGIVDPVVQHLEYLSRAAA